MPKNVRVQETGYIQICTVVLVTQYSDLRIDTDSFIILTELGELHQDYTG